MEWKDITKLIADLAPSLGTAIGSVVPGGALIGGAAGRVLQSIFGTSEPDKLISAIITDPDRGMKLRMAEIQFETEKMKIDLDETKAYLADVQSARSREIAVVQATGSKDTNLYVLAWSMVGGFFGLLATLMFVPLPADQSGVIFMLFGALSTSFGCVISYFFGSSKGSADKSILLANGKR